MSRNLFDPLKAGAHVSYADGGATAIIAGDQDCAFVQYGRDVALGGKFAFGCEIAAEALNTPGVGVGKIGQDYNETLGWTGLGWLYLGSASPIKIHSGVGGAYGIPLQTTWHYVLCLLDLDAGTIGFRTTSGAPGPGTDHGIMYSGLSGVIYPAVNVGNSGPETTHFTIDCEGPFYIDLPAGYVPFAGAPAALGSLLALL